MIILLDANLSWRLIPLLKSHFDEVYHIEKIQLPQPVKDSEIWEYAKNINAVILTKDEDFYKLSVAKGFPPKVVILRMGNQSLQFISEVIIKHAKEIQKFHESDYGLLEII